MNIAELVNALEAVLFASARPMSESELKKIVARWMMEYVPAEALLQTEEPAEQTEGLAVQIACAQDAPHTSEATNIVSTCVPAVVTDAAEQAPLPEAPIDAPLSTAEHEHTEDRGDAQALSATEAKAPDKSAMWDWRAHFKAAIAALKHRWQERAAYSGFALLEVAGGLTFRSRSEYASVLLAMREEKPHRLSRPAMETLAIVAYRQPVTKPECDQIRGVDCGGTIKMLLEKNLLRIVGKKEEPGRPLLYGTSPDFLSFFNLPTLNELPSLRNFSELEDTDEETGHPAGQPTLQELSASAKQFRLDDEPEIETLEQAVHMLRQTEQTSRTALAAEGIVLQDSDAEKLSVPETKSESGSRARLQNNEAAAVQSP